MDIGGLFGDGYESIRAHTPSGWFLCISTVCCCRSLSPCPAWFIFVFIALLIDVFTKSECSSNNVVFQTPYIAEETAKPSPPKNHDLDSLNGNFLDSELKEENSYLLSFEDVKSNKCHPSEIDFSSPSWYSLYSLLYFRKDQFQKRQDCMFSKYKEYSIFFEFEVEMSLNRVH